MSDEIITTDKVKGKTDRFIVSANTEQIQLVIDAFAQTLVFQMSFEPIKDYKELIDASAKRLVVKEFLTIKIKEHLPYATFSPSDLILVTNKIDVDDQKLICHVLYIETREGKTRTRHIVLSIRTSTEITKASVVSDHYEKISEFVGRVEPTLLGIKKKERVDSIIASLR